MLRTSLADKWSDRKRFSWTFKKVLLFIFSLFLPISLCYTLFSEVTPKSTNHRSHNCNYCINTKQRTGDAQKRVWLEWNTKRLQSAMARGNKMQTLTAKRERKEQLFFSFSVSFGFMWWNLSLIKKSGFTWWQQTGFTEAAMSRVPWGWPPQHRL